MRRSKQRKRPYSQIEQENLDLRDALEQIADILEEVGVLESEEEVEDVILPAAAAPSVEEEQTPEEQQP